MNGLKGDETAADIHTERSIIREMEIACADLEDEIAEMEAEEAAILEELNTTIGDLSDLRYGRFGKTLESSEELGPEVIQSIRRVQEACNEARNQ
jgi:centromere-localized protein 2